MAFSAALLSIAPLSTFFTFLSLSSALSSSLFPEALSSSAWRRFSAMISLMVSGWPPFILLQPLREVLPWRTILPSLEPEEGAGARWEKSPDGEAEGREEGLLRALECAMFLIFWQSSSAAPFSPLTTSLKFLVM